MLNHSLLSRAPVRPITSNPEPSRIASGSIPRGARDLLNFQNSCINACDMIFSIALKVVHITAAYSHAVDLRYCPPAAPPSNSAFVNFNRRSRPDILRIWEPMSRRYLQPKYRFSDENSEQAIK